MVSIIIPVYNAESSLQACLDSVCHQSLRDIEVICVDDGSTDSSVQVIQKYAASDPRVRLIQQKNQFAGIARNNGLKAAKGEWLFFLDADDAVMPHALESAYHTCLQYDLDCLKFPALTYDEHGKQYVRRVRNDFSLLRPGDFYRLLQLDAESPLLKVSVAPWSGLYRKDFVLEHGIEYNALRCVNDRSFYTRVITNHPRIMCSRDRVTLHRISAGGSLVDGKAKYFDCQIQSLLITERQLEEDRVPDGIARLIMQQEYRDCIFWYSKYAVVPEQKSRMDVLIQDYLTSGETKYGDELQGMLGCASSPAKSGADIVEHPIRPACVSPLVTILLPISDSAQILPLRLTLESLYQQDLDAMEILVLQDGSSPEKELLLLAYQDLDQRFVSVSHAGASVQDKLDSGIAQAQGKYITILHPGDFPAKRMYHWLSQTAQTNHLDWVGTPITPCEVTPLGTLSAFRSSQDSYEALCDKTFSPAKEKNAFLQSWNLQNGIVRLSLMREVWPCAEQAPLPELALWLQTLCLSKRIRFLPESLCNQLRKPFSVDPFPGDPKDDISGTYRTVLQWLHSSPALSRTFEDALYAKMYTDLMDQWSHLPDHQRAPFLSQLREELLPAAEAHLLHSNILDDSSLRRAKRIMDSPERYLKSVELSIIIPVYNEEQHLAQALEALLHQASFSMEIICVDDGSTDSSPEILRKFSANDQRLKVLSITHSGAGAARNRGMEAARGDHLIFLDADDLFEPDLLNLALAKAQNEDLDVTIFLHNDYDDVYFRFHNPLEFPPDMLPKQTPFSITDMAYNPFRMFERWVWNKLFKTSFLKEHELRFAELPSCNDLSFVGAALAAAKRINVINTRSLVHHRMSIGGLSLIQQTGDDSIFKALLCLRDELKRLTLYGKQKSRFQNYALSFLLSQIATTPGENGTSLYESFVTSWLPQLGLDGRTPLQIENSTDQWLLQQAKKLPSDKYISAILQHYQPHSFYTEAQQKVSTETLCRSASYRIGQAVTCVPRKIRTCIWFFQKYGFQETVQYGKSLLFKRHGR